MTVLVECVIISVSLLLGFCFETFLQACSCVQRLSQGDVIPFKGIKSFRVYGETRIQNQAFIKAVSLISVIEQRLTLQML